MKNVQEHFDEIISPNSIKWIRNMLILFEFLGWNIVFFIRLDQNLMNFIKKKKQRAAW